MSLEDKGFRPKLQPAYRDTASAYLQSPEGTCENPLTQRKIAQSEPRGRARSRFLELSGEMEGKLEVMRLEGDEYIKKDGRQ